MGRKMHIDHTIQDTFVPSNVNPQSGSLINKTKLGNESELSFHEMIANLDWPNPRVVVRVS